MAEIKRWREPIIRLGTASPYTDQPDANELVKSWREHRVYLDDIGVNHPGNYFQYQYTELRHEIDGEVADRQTFDSRAKAVEFLNRERTTKEAEQ